MECMSLHLRASKQNRSELTGIWSSNKWEITASTPAAAWRFWLHLAVELSFPAKTWKSGWESNIGLLQGRQKKAPLKHQCCGVIKSTSAFILSRYHWDWRLLDNEPLKPTGFLYFREKKHTQHGLWLNRLCYQVHRKLIAYCIVCSQLSADLCCWSPAWRKQEI